MCATVSWGTHESLMHPSFVLKNGCDNKLYSLRGNHRPWSSRRPWPKPFRLLGESWLQSASCSGGEWSGSSLFQSLSLAVALTVRMKIVKANWGHHSPHHWHLTLAGCVSSGVALKAFRLDMMSFMFLHILVLGLYVTILLECSLLCHSNFQTDASVILRRDW
jgi:hypothetical protein